jgi:hypothetical protein
MGFKLVNDRPVLFILNCPEVILFPLSTEAPFEKTSLVAIFIPVNDFCVETGFF